MVLIGTWIAFLFKNEAFASAGLVWIAVNVLLSYGRAGLAKVQQQEWKDGTALQIFLEQSFFSDIRALKSKISPENSKKISWAIILLEFALVFSPLAEGALLTGVFLVVVLFHFLNYWAFGLNRFFWAWLAAWPAVFFLSSVLHARLQ